VSALSGPALTAGDRPCCVVSFTMPGPPGSLLMAWHELGMLVWSIRAVVVIGQLSSMWMSESKGGHHSVVLLCCAGMLAVACLQPG
jgi:hypothetical protein